MTSNSCNHLKALLKKNWILFKRSPCGSCCEIITPIFFIIILSFIRSSVGRDPIKETSYIDSSVNFSPQLKGNFTSGSVQGLDQAQKAMGCSDEFTDYYIALSPKSNSIVDALEAKLRSFPIPPNIIKFDDINQMDAYAESEYYGSESKPYLCFGVAVTTASNGNYEYSLRFNSSNKEIYDTADVFPITVSFVKKDFEDSNLFTSSGFLTLQTWIDNIILQTEKADSSASIDVNIASVRIPAYEEDNFSIYMTGQTNVFLVLPMVVPFLRMISRLLYEKEKKIKEGMKMMGMSNFSFYLSWFITYTIIYTFICFVNTCILCQNVFQNSNGFLLFFFLWFFCIVLMFQSLFVSVFFTRVKPGLIGGLIFFFALYIINYVISSDEISFEVKEKASLSSHCAMAFAAETLMSLETNSAGLTSENMKVLVNNYKIETFFQFEFINIAIFSILSVYLDLVFPNEFGQKKHPLFFLKFLCQKRRSKAKVSMRPSDIEDQSQNSPILSPSDMKPLKANEEQVDGNLKQQEREDQALLIKNLSKVYPNGKKAVDDLSLNIYQNQIFVLLGHNGAGKTTTISILTGLLLPSSGTAYIMGRDILTDMEFLRRRMGVCPQHDILFDTLTVEEHLYLFASFKGVDSKKAKEEVEKIIEDVDLRAKKKDLAKNLSGGQRRRLSVGIAFIGGSKLILLDEPTSGMDTSARRFIWEMLKNYKNDRIVILTTHFMDEADFLGDRIGIMGEGTLKCCGSSVFLKNKFGVGYNLVIAKESAENNPAIEEFVRSKVKTAKCISHVSAEITFQLPIPELPNFKELFNGLDENLKEFKIASYGISITTLEEVFLKVAEGNDPSKNLKFDRKNTEKEQIDDFNLASVKVKSKFALFWIHFSALFMKRVQYSKRDKKGLFCEILLPMIIVVCGLCLTFIQFLTESPLLPMSPSILTLKVKAPVQGTYSWFFNDNNFPNHYFDFLSSTDSSANQDSYQFDSFVFKSRDQSNNGLYGAFFMKSISGSNYSYLAFYNSTTPSSPAIFVNQMNQAIVRSATGRDITINCNNYPFPLTQQQKAVTGTANGFIASFIFSIALSFIPASMIAYIVKEKAMSIKHQQLVSGVSLLAYWSANYVVDFLKLIIPMIFSVLMCLAFDITTLVEPDESFGALWLLFILFGTSLISFTYACSFLFKDYGSAQTAMAIFFFLMGAIGSLIILVLKFIDSTRDGAKIGQYFARIFPPFCLGYGLLNISNRELLAVLEKYYVEKGALDTDVAAWDIIYEGIFTVVYLIMIYFFEKILTIPSFHYWFSREKSITYDRIQLDEDVEQEIERISSTKPEDYTVYVKDLRKVFMLGGGRKKVAVSKTSFGIENGECFGLLGVNGAGKTTTYKMLCGEIMPSSGEAYINGHNIVADVSGAREYIGYCPQFDALLDNLTAKEHLYLYAALKGIPKEMRKDLVEKKLVEMRLKQYENVCAGTYSGGNKRKLSVAIAMLGNPPIVFLDEPSTGMDPEARRFMWNVISRISSARKKSSIILTTHSMEEAEALSTRMSIMVNGTLKCLGSVQHIKSKFGKGYEIEVKTKLPEAGEIDEILKKLQMARSVRINFQQVPTILQNLGRPHYLNNFQKGGSAFHLLLECQKLHGLAVEVLVEYSIIEDYGALIMDFLKSEFGDFSILEHFQSFFRFKLNASASIGKKDKLNISQYSIRQATIEQIFNMFATEQDNELMEENKKKGVINKKVKVVEKFEMEAGAIQAVTQKGE